MNNSIFTPVYKFRRIYTEIHAGRLRSLNRYRGCLMKGNFKWLTIMSECDVVIRGEGTEMLVQGNERLHLHNERQIDRSSLRWSLASGRRIRISRAVDQIIRSIENNSDRVYASSHLQYINREAAFQKRGGCIETGHNLPTWAEDNPKKFLTLPTYTVRKMMSDIRKSNSRCRTN